MVWTKYLHILAVLKIFSRKLPNANLNNYNQSRLNDSVDTDYFYNFPIKNEEEFLEFESKLADRTYQLKLVSCF